MKHALVVGGTGMLAGVSLWLAEKRYHVSVIARNENRMNTLISRASSPFSITPLFIDYSDENRLRKEMQRTSKQNGPPQLIIAWIHSTGRNALGIIAEEASKVGGKNGKLYHVISSSTNLEEAVKSVEIPVGCLYRQIQLGFVIENGDSRWLTHEEIASGIIDAIRHDKLLHIVGTVEPWDRRP